MAELHDILVRPLITEKATELTTSQNTYLFRVALGANKHEIKDAVERFFAVKVLDVRTSRQRGKVKRSGNNYSLRPSWKKAFVRLAEGHSINFMDS